MVRNPPAPRLLVLSPTTSRPALAPIRHAARKVWPHAEVLAEELACPPGVFDRWTVGWTARMLGGVLDRVRPDLVLSTDRSLTRALDWLRRNRGLPLPVASLAPTGSTDALVDALHELGRTPPLPGSRRLPAADALFAHIDAPTAPQHVGTVLVFEPGPELTAGHAALMLAGVPGALGRIEPGTAVRGTRWVPVAGRTAESRVDSVLEGDLSTAVDAFFSAPLRPEQAVSAARLVTGLADGRRALLVKLHHALGDGMTVLQALLSDVDNADRLSWATRPAVPVGCPGVPGLRAGVRPVLSGLRALAAAGRSPGAPTDGPLPDARRHHALGRLPGTAVRAGARAVSVGTAEFLLATFAQAWHDIQGSTHGLDRFRLMVPWSVRGTDSLRVAGNHTGAVSLDLPVGPMAFGDRARRVAAIVRSDTESGVPEAANLVTQSLGALPPVLHRAAARSAYRGAWFSGIGTVLPGPRREVRWHGAVMSEAHPVLALAPGTGLAWGALTWGPWITLCVTTTRSWAANADALTARIAELVTEHPHHDRKVSRS